MADQPQWANRARHFLSMEADAITAMAGRLNGEFDRAVALLLDTSGKAVVTGMGKGGHVGNKIAATLSSTGTPSLFLHPAEAVHGDLGVVSGSDVVIAISNSGETEEVLRILPAVKRVGAPLIAIVGNTTSTLAQKADVVLDASVAVEACPHNLAPTSTTTCALALGDALALCTMEARGFTTEQYAMLHPAGALGRRLLLRVRDVMRTGDDLAIVHGETSLLDTMFAITNANAGAACVVDADRRLTGLVTDGDVRRQLLKDASALSKPVSEAVTKMPLTVRPDDLAAEGLHTFESRTTAIEGKTRRVGDMPVVDAEGRPVGMLMLKDLLQAGLV
ncbi:MAG TPA: KpsF/GutQ family sugar-phosphate isomerase [Armatimonadota bacterium]